MLLLVAIIIITILLVANILVYVTDIFDPPCKRDDKDYADVRHIMRPKIYQRGYKKVALPERMSAKLRVASNIHDGEDPTQEWRILNENYRKNINKTPFRHRTLTDGYDA